MKLVIAGIEEVYTPKFDTRDEAIDRFEAAYLAHQTMIVQE